MRTRSTESGTLLLEHHKRNLTCNHSTCRCLTKLVSANVLVKRSVVQVSKISRANRTVRSGIVYCLRNSYDSSEGSRFRQRSCDARHFYFGRFRAFFGLVNYVVENPEQEAITAMKSGKWVAYAARTLLVRFWDLTKVSMFWYGYL
jgi:hypothetical protein